MRAYFTRKPLNIEAVLSNAERAKAEGKLPTKVNPIARVKLDNALYTAFCRDPLKDWGFLAAHADQAVFRGDDAADCVIIECHGMISLAVCCEGCAYGRCVGCLVSAFDLKVMTNCVQQLFDGCFEGNGMLLPGW